MEGIKTEEAQRTFMTWPLRFIEILTSMPLWGKLFLLVIIALIPRIIVFLQPQIITIDGTLYIKMAKLFSEGQYGGIPGSYFNLYPFLIFLVQKLIGDWELSGQLISITLGTLTVIPIFLLGRSLYDERVGWLSALFYITLPNFLRFDTDVLRDPTYWFFLALTLWLTWEGLKKNRLLLMGLASISAGLGAITRVDGFTLWAALAIFTAFGKVPKVSLRRRALNATVLILFFPLLLSPVLWSVKKHPSQTAFGEMITFPLKFMTNHARVILQPQDPIPWMGPKVYESLHYIPRGAVDLASRHRVVLAISEVIYKFIKSANLLIVLILLGLWKRKREGFESPDWYLLVVFAGLFIMSVLYARQIYYFSTRHGLTLVLPCFFFAGHGLDFMAERFSQGSDHLTSRWNIIKKYLVHLLTLVIIIVFLAQALSFKSKEKFIQKEMGLWLKEKGYQGSVIMGPKQLLRLAFYADGKFVEMPDSWGKALDIIQQNGVRIVLVDPCTIEQECPDFSKNLADSRLFPIQGPKGKAGKCEIQIYEVY